MEVYVLGSGNAFSKKRNNTSFVIKEKDEYYMIDCPKSLMSNLEEFRYVTGIEIPISKLDRMFSTHVHGDHVGDAEALVYWKHFVEKKKPEIITTEEIFSELEERLSSIPKSCDWRTENKTKFSDYVNFTPLSYGRPAKIGNLTVEAYPATHAVETTALKFTAEDGKTFAYSSDTIYDAKLIDWLYKDADLVFHEADSNNSPVHTPVKVLEEKLTKEQKALTFLIHVPDNLESEIPVIDDYSIIGVKKIALKESVNMVRN